MTSLEIMQKPAWLHQHSHYQWNFSFFHTDLSTRIAPFHQLLTCLRFFLLLPLVVVYQIQPSNVVELQQHSPLSNNTSVTTYIHRMIISPPCLFKHMKNDECVAMLFQCLLDHPQQKLYFCLISFLLSSDIRSEGSIAIVKILDFEDSLKSSQNEVEKLTWFELFLFFNVVSLYTNTLSSALF